MYFVWILIVSIFLGYTLFSWKEGSYVCIFTNSLQVSTNLMKTKNRLEGWFQLLDLVGSLFRDQHTNYACKINELTQFRSLGEANAWKTCEELSLHNLQSETANSFYIWKFMTPNNEAICEIFVPHKFTDIYGIYYANICMQSPQTGRKGNTKYRGTLE